MIGLFGKAAPKTVGMFSLLIIMVVLSLLTISALSCACITDSELHLVVEKLMAFAMQKLVNWSNFNYNLPTANACVLINNALFCLEQKTFVLYALVRIRVCPFLCCDCHCEIFRMQGNSSSTM